MISDRFFLLTVSIDLGFGIQYNSISPDLEITLLAGTLKTTLKEAT